MQKVDIRAVIQNRAADGDADRATQIAHQVEQSGGEFEPLGRETTQRQRDNRRDRELLTKTAQRLRKQQLMPPPFMRNGSEGPHTQREAAKPKHHEPTQIDAPGEKGIERNRTDLEQTGRE